MTRTIVRGAVAAAVLAALAVSLSGAAPAAFAAGKPKGAPDTTGRVALYNQATLVAQGLTPAAALQKARGYLSYTPTTPHYMPNGFQLLSVRVYPYIPNQSLLGDTQTFYNIPRGYRVVKGHRPAPIPSFEVDHQLGAPFSYPGGVAFFTQTTASLHGRKVNVSEQKATDFRRHTKIDLVYIYWYDTRTKLATEVTSELFSSGLSRTTLLKIADSVR